MLEQASWIAGIVAAIAAIAALFIGGAAVIRKAKTKQTATIKGDRNSINQTNQVNGDK